MGARGERKCPMIQKSTLKIPLGEEGGGRKKKKGVSKRTWKAVRSSEGFETRGVRLFWVITK